VAAPDGHRTGTSIVDTTGRTTTAPGAPRHALAFGPFTLLRAERLLLDDGMPVRLGGRAFDLLIALVERAGEVVSREVLEACVWPRTVVEETSLRAHVSALRKALGDGHGGARYIINQPGRGYCFVAEVRRSRVPEHDVSNDAAISARRGLPARLTRLIGRADAVENLSAQLEAHRFVTIVGTGGIGKTTVALAVAETCANRYADGVAFIDLAAIAHDPFVPSAMALGCGLAISEEDVVARLSGFLRDRQMLVVLDNCEHVIDGVAPLVEQLLKAAPGLEVLATARVPLHAEGEWVHHLPALGLPAVPEGLSAEQALAYPAVQLFVDRATMSFDSFALLDADAPLVGALCHRLDGNPLAIELAAARVNVFGVRGLAQQLDAHLLHLRDPRATVARHASLGVMLDWSWGLLTELERAILRQLAVFRGRFPLESALELIALDEATAPDRVFEALMDLVDKSLVISDVGSDTVFFRLLDLTRAYALEKLADDGQRAVVAARHAEVILASMRRAAQAWPEVANNRQWLEVHGWAADDIRAALAWAFAASGNPLVGAWLAAIVWPLAIQLNPFDEPGAIERALQAVEGLPDTPPELEVRLRIGSAAFRMRRRDPAAQDAMERALEVAERSGDPKLEAEALMGITVGALVRGSYELAFSHAERLQAAARRSQDPVTMLVADRFGAQACHFAGDHARARLLAERVLSHPLPRGPMGPGGVIGHAVSMRIVLGRILWLEGYADEAAIVVEQALAHAEADGPPAVCQVLSLAACPVALWRGDVPAAQRWITRLECEYTNQTVRGNWSALTAGMPWRRVLEAQSRHAGSTARSEIVAGEAVSLLQIDHLISAHPSFVTRDAAARASSGGAGWCGAEILRARGEMLLQGAAHGARADAETLFQRARALARQQGALAWELRAATSLAALWTTCGRASEARAVLQPVYHRFTEGFATADLRRATALLDALKAS
jgi:predicted ATPase/DNA-binding winged helix-turn-helix (wHTH) protein